MIKESWVLQIQQITAPIRLFQDTVTYCEHSTGGLKWWKKWKKSFYWNEKCKQRDENLETLKKSNIENFRKNQSFREIFSSSKISCIFVFRWVYEMLNSSLIVDISRCAEEINLWLVPMILCRRRKVFRKRLISGCMVMETRTCTSKKCALAPFLCMLSLHKAWLLQQLQQTNPVSQHGRERVLEMRDLHIREILVVASENSVYS